MSHVDWVTVSSLATAGGTLVLAAATFSAVRSANVAARTAERSLLVGQRPVLFQSHIDDPVQKIRWGDNHWAAVQGGRGRVENVDGNVYLAMSLRNVGSGIAVIQGWAAMEEDPARRMDRPDPKNFFSQTRDLYVPAGDASFWQAGVREPDHPHRAAVLAGYQAGILMVDVLYSDHEGGQRTISRFSLVRPSDGNQDGNQDGNPDWLCSVVRHWNLDRQDPR